MNEQNIFKLIVYILVLINILVMAVGYFSGWHDCKNRYHVDYVDYFLEE